MAGEIMIAPILKMLVLLALDQVTIINVNLQTVFHISIKQMRPTVLKVTSVLLEELMTLRAVLKFAMMECGELSVMISGVQMMA